MSADVYEVDVWRSRWSGQGPWSFCIPRLRVLGASADPELSAKQILAKYLGVSTNDVDIRG